MKTDRLFIGLMISKNRQKLIRSLERKKGRTEAGLFVAEGPKLVGELLSAGWKPAYIAATEAWWTETGEAGHDHALLLKQQTGNEPSSADTVTEDELQRCSFQKTPQQVLALFPIQEYDEPLYKVASQELCLALDGVQDPGNLGTIVRLADWFGIRHIYCSPATADIFSPKAIQATMGAISRVHVHYINMPGELSRCQAPIYGTHLHGDNLYEKTLTAHGVIVMGNEGKGISPEVEALINEKLYIPPYPADRTTVESLNVAIATAIVCAEFRRIKG